MIPLKCVLHAGVKTAFSCFCKIKISDDCDNDDSGFSGQGLTMTRYVGIWLAIFEYVQHTQGKK